MADIPRIKGNISKMIAQGAPEADIDTYLATEGVGLDQLKTAPPPDQYQQAAIDEDKAVGGANPGFTRRLTHGATLGADSTIMAGLMTPLEMFKRGINPKEAYNYTKAREDLIMNKSRENTGLAGDATEMLGGVLGGGTVAGGIGSMARAPAGGFTALANPGLSVSRFLAPEAGLAARSGASALDAAGLGAFSGAMEGNGLEQRGENALKGGAFGALLGGATPGLLAGAGTLASPILSQIRARTNPAAYAQSQVGRAVSESGMTPQQIAAGVQGAAAEGQGMFTAADAMGNAGQRMLATTARSPGQARTDVGNFLDARQAGQGRRVSNALAEGFDAPQTAAQTEARLTAARGAEADRAYGEVRRDAGQVDLVPTINHLDQRIGTEPGQALQPANDSVEGVLRPFRERLARVNPDDFEAVQRIRFDMADAAQNARQSGYGNRAREIGNAVRQLDTAMEAASPGHRAANANFRQASQDIEAVDTGRTAAMRGRTEDTIPAFQGLRPQGQEAFRAGYVDPLIAQTQGAAVGVNKARPLINDAFQAEAGAMAPGNPLMQRRIGRENTMFETRHEAMGGSKTAHNINDDAAMGVAPEEAINFVGQIVTGRFGGALNTALSAGKNFFSGNTPEVRQAVAQILLQRGPNVDAAQFQAMVNRTVQQIQQVQQMARSMGRGAAGGLAVAGPGQNKEQAITIRPIR